MQDAEGARTRYTKTVRAARPKESRVRRRLSLVSDRVGIRAVQPEHIPCVHLGCEHFMFLTKGKDPTTSFYRCPLGHRISESDWLRMAPRPDNPGRPPTS